MNTRKQFLRDGFGLAAILSSQTAPAILVRSMVAARNGIVAAKRGGGAPWFVRNIRFHVSSLMGGNIGSLVLLQFSRIDLIDENDNVYVWPSGATVTATLSDGSVCTKGSPFTVGQYAAQESPSNIIDGSVDTKVCLNCTGFLPVDFVIDVGETLVDLTKFSRWRWWTGNDNWQRGPSEFNLAVSADGASWDIADIPSAAVQTTSYKSIAYTGDISRG